MKEEKYQPLSLNHKGCVYMPSEEVRSAVMGLYRAIGEIEKHHSIQEDSNLGAFTAVVIREELRDWFPVFFEDVDESGVQE